MKNRKMFLLLIPVVLLVGYLLYLYRISDPWWVEMSLTAPEDFTEGPQEIVMTIPLEVRGGTLTGEGTATCSFTTTQVPSSPYKHAVTISGPVKLTGRHTLWGFKFDKMEEVIPTKSFSATIEPISGGKSTADAAFSTTLAELGTLGAIWEAETQYVIFKYGWGKKSPSPIFALDGAKANFLLWQITLHRGAPPPMPPIP
jgi:hypothetical protein